MKRPINDSETPVSSAAIANGWGWVLGVRGERTKRPTSRQAGAKKRLRTLWARADAMCAHGQVVEVINRLRVLPYVEHRNDRRLVEAIRHLEAAERCLFLFYAAIATAPTPDESAAGVQIASEVDGD